MLEILHVERSELFRKIMAEVVTRCGHAVRSARSLAGMRMALAEKGFDLVLTGLELDDGSGEDLIRELGAGAQRDVPIIVITSTDSIQVRERLFSLGVIDYLLKNEIEQSRICRYLEALAAQDELSRYMRGLKVAVLDDSVVILKIVTNILRLNGFESVTTFERPEELLASSERFDLYLSDIVLPGMTGEQVVSSLRAAGSEGIIICMSQFATDKPIAGILLAGADDYIQKPFDALGLISRIKVNVRAYQLKKKLELAAVTDGLTGLYNHRYVLDRLEEEIAKARRYGRRLSAYMFDIDDFKKVNDRFGHRAGDELLRAVSGVIREHTRSSDVAGRYGGEEFIVILPEAGRAEAALAAEKLRAAIAALAVGAEGRLRATVYIGAAELAPGDDAGGLVSRVDALLYEAKRAGKDRVSV